MKLTFIAAALMAASLTLTGCGKKDDVQGKTGDDITAKSSAKDIGEAYINELTRVADALESVEDEASARKAAEKLQVAIKGLNSMQEELEDELTGVKAMQIFGGRYTELIAVQQRLSVAMIEVQTEHPELMEIVNEELDKMDLK